MSVLAMERMADEEADGAAGVSRPAAALADELLLRCRRIAYVSALQLVGNREDALDVAQDAIVRLLRAGALDPEQAWRAYVVRIVRNLVHDLWRRRRVRRAESLEALVLEQGFDVADHQTPADERAAVQQLRRRAAAALAGLPEIYREILVLRDYQDLSYAEIAAALGVPLGTVMSRLHKARLLLREAVLGGRRTT